MAARGPAAALAAAVVLALGGCGGSGDPTSKPAAARRTTTGRSSPAPPRAGSDSRGVAGAPGKAASTAPAPESQPSAAANGALAQRAFQARANAACEAAATRAAPGAAARMPHTSHGQGASPSASATSAQHMGLQMKILALSRLRAPASLRAPVSALLETLARLRQLDMAGLPAPGAPSRPSDGAPQSFARTVELQASSYARQAGVPACAPAGAAG